MTQTVINAYVYSNTCSNHQENVTKQNLEANIYKQNDILQKFKQHTENKENRGTRKKENKQNK